MRLTGLWWWIDRWRKSTAYTDMTLEEQGAYRNLLDEATLRGGPLPNDENILAKACGDARRWRKVRQVVLARFELRDDGWHNATLDEVNARSAEISAQRSAAGIAGNRARWEGRNDHRKPVAEDIANCVANGVAEDIANGVANTIAPDPDPGRSGRAARGPGRTGTGRTHDPDRPAAAVGRAPRAASASSGKRPRKQPLSPEQDALIKKIFG